MAVRAESASLRQKEREVERALLQQAKADRAAKIQADYESLNKSEEVAVEEEVEEEEVARPPPRKRKPARRVVHVTEVSSASGSETEEVEVRLPRKRKTKTAEEVAYERAANKMFNYD